MGDHPVPELDGKTLLQAAKIPNLRRAAAAGTVKLVKTVPDGMSPGSDVANLSIMGFDPRKYYTGRAPIEAAGAGIAMELDDIAFRCNLITVEHDLIKDHSAGHITTEEARHLIETLDAQLGNERLRFITGTSYRHLVIWKNGPEDIKTTPPHDVLDQPVKTHLPKGARHDEVIQLMEKSKQILAEHPVSRARLRQGKAPATQIWLWGQGHRTLLPSYQENYGLSGGVISAVNLIHGIGRLAGLDAVELPGATGFIDTDYNAKVKAAFDILAKQDFVFVHVEAPDECGHMGNLNLKLKAIEAFDGEIVGPVWKGLESMNCSYCLVLGTDHCTPVAIRCHTDEPVPMTLLKGPTGRGNKEQPFDEYVDNGHVSGMAFEWLQTILNQKQS